MTVDLLLEAGADPSIADYTGTSTLHQAVGLGATQYVPICFAGLSVTDIDFAD